MVCSAMLFRGSESRSTSSAGRRIACNVCLRASAHVTTCVLQCFCAYECIHFCVYTSVYILYVIVALSISYVSVGVAFRRSKRSTFQRSKRSTFRHSKRTPGRDIGGSLQITAKFSIITSLHHCLMCFCDKIVIIYIHLFTASCATTSCVTIVLYYFSIF